MDRVPVLLLVALLPIQVQCRLRAGGLDRTTYRNGGLRFPESAGPVARVGPWRTVGTEGLSEAPKIKLGHY
jgi:hypothetical protein